MNGKGEVRFIELRVRIFCLALPCSNRKAVGSNCGADEESGRGLLVVLFCLRSHSVVTAMVETSVPLAGGKAHNLRKLFST